MTVVDTIMLLLALNAIVSCGVATLLIAWARNGRPRALNFWVGVLLGPLGILLAFVINDAPPAQPVTWKQP